MREEDSVRALETLGLTGKEADAYLHLLQHGPSTAQQVSQLLGVQYPAVYRVLQSLQSKGWIDVSQERPNRYRARAPRIVSEEARQSRHDDLLAAAEVVGSLKETPPPKNRGADADLWIYNGPESTGRKLRVFILNSFYRDGQFVSDKLQGLWVGDMDFVRVQLEAMLLDLAEPKGKRVLPRS